MSKENEQPSIYLIVEFNWPEIESPEMYKGAGNLHKVIEVADWIEEVFAGFGGVGKGKASIWIFKMRSYSILDKLLNSYNSDQNEVSRAYSTFFKLMVDVEEKIREEVVFV
jgi:hypothetical protein